MMISCMTEKETEAKAIRVLIIDLKNRMAEYRKKYPETNTDESFTVAYMESDFSEKKFHIKASPPWGTSQTD